MRKILSILFILVFLFNIIGYYPVFLFRHLQHKNALTQMLNKQISTGNLLVLSFDKDESKLLKWIKKNEFSYKGEMYDIIMTKTGGDGKTYYYCVLDKKEKHLLVQFEQHVKRHIALEGNTSQKQEKIVKSLVKDYLPVEVNESALSSGIEISFSIMMISYESIIPSKKSPPPKVA